VPVLDRQRNDMKKNKQTLGRQKGFTLIELMVAVFVGAIVIWGVYTIFVGGQRIFHEEHRISQSQLAVRLGMDVIKNDIKRAGFLSSPNIDLDPMVCRNQGGPALLRLHPIVHTNGTAGLVYTGSSGQIPNVSQNAYIAPDAIVLTGNYISATSYLAQTIQAAAGTIMLQNISRRLLPGEDPNTLRAVPTDGEFAMMFPQNAYLRVVNKYGYIMFSQVNSVSDAATRTINANPLPDSSLADIRCGIDGYGEGSEVNVVDAVMYRIEVDPNDTTGKKTDLVRWEVSIGVDGTFAPIAGRREVIIEYAVDFQVWFREDDPAAAGPQIDYPVDIPADDVIVIGHDGALLDGTASAHPENLRAAVIRISVRTAEEDPTFPFVARAAGDPLTRFELDPQALGAAHVRTLEAQVELPNISLRNLNNL
jgi:prepilin-type N-terminal cleavage/methylation domain-containing protein